MKSLSFFNARQRHCMVQVADKQVHHPLFTTLFFDLSLDFSPGQFVMLWIPGLDEKPYTLSFHSSHHIGITIEAKGKFSQKAASLNPGDMVGIRGPFGRGFTIMDSPNLALVAGGCGMAPLAPLAERLSSKVCFIHGARSKDLLLYPDRLEQERHFCTDDGSFGFKGFVTQVLEQKIQERRKKGEPPFDMVFSCGPEAMMYQVFLLCETHDIPCQVSLERYMRCGFGVCGACVCGDRLVCCDGPVFFSHELRTMKDFNHTVLLKSGQSVSFGDDIHL